MKILKKSQIIAAEQGAVKNGALSLSQLMFKAGTAFADCLAGRYNIIGAKITVVCGRGNNGGDGLVIASRLKHLGADVNLVFPLGLPGTETAMPYLNVIEKVKVLPEIPTSCDILIDALFGIGLSRELEGVAANVVELMNICEAIKVSVDIPSGIDADAEFVSKTAFKADFTATFIALKPCFVMPITSGYCGEYEVLDIGVKPQEYSYLVNPKPIFKKRPKNSHKGTFGTALFIAGSYGMCGAEILAVRSAYALGVGMCRAFVCDKNYTAFTTSIPEAVTIPVSTSPSGAPIITNELLQTELLKSEALLVGCGLGNTNETQNLLKKALELTSSPTVIDADGINALSTDISILQKTKAPIIITPHPKEMSRLIHKSVEEIERNRVYFAKAFATMYGCIVVLKGANTVIASPDGRVFVNTTGNSGLAVSGSGDVLAGMIVSLLAQGYSPLTAAMGSVYLHGAAADNAVKRISQAALLPSDVIEELRNGGYLL